MTTPSLAENIYYVGVNDYETCLFEALWPLPEGISYNSYLIIDEKITLIDTVKKSFIPEYLQKIKRILPTGRTVDYLIINHIEPDHSGALTALLDVYPAMQIVGNKKTLELLNDFYGVSTQTVTVKDRDTLSLGKRTLQFLLAPMVHWPETMFTYEPQTQTLFSGDVFGGFGALQGGIFDDEVDLTFYVDEIRRYFSNIIGKYCVMVQKAFAHLDGIPIKTIASTHGPIFRKDPRFIMDLYGKWSRHETEPGAVIVYASMYGNTQRMAEAVARGLAENGVEKIKMFNISRTHISFIINELWRFRALILGSCTYNTTLFPLMGLLLSVLETDGIKEHLLGLFGSYSWSGGALAQLRDFAKKGSWTLIDPVIEVKCAPTDEKLADCFTLGKNCAQALQAHSG